MVSKKTKFGIENLKIKVSKVWNDYKYKFCVDDIEPVYFIRTFNTKTNTMSNSIISEFKRSSDGFDNFRVYDMEVDGVKFFFNLNRSDNKLYLSPHSNSDLEKLKNEHNIIIIPESNSISN